MGFGGWQLTFQTKVYHPGINDEGQICVPVLRDQVCFGREEGCRI